MGEYEVVEERWCGRGCHEGATGGEATLAEARLSTTQPPPPFPRSHATPYGLVEYGSLARRAFQTIKQVLYYENLARSEAREPNTSIYNTTFEKNHTKKYSFHLKL